MIKISYPITDEARKEIEDYPAIAAAFPLAQTDRSEYEIVRLLSNTHDVHIKNLLEFIDKRLALSGAIGRKLLKAKHPFEFEQANAELFLFAQLQERIDNVKAVESGAASKCPGIEICLDDIKVWIEVYTPVDFMGFQLFETYVPMVLKYLDVDRGYHLRVRTSAVQESSNYDHNGLFYPYSFPDESDVHAWLMDFAKNASEWLSKDAPNSAFVMCGPGDGIDVEIELVESIDDPSDRLITMDSATRSTDTKLFFQVGSAADTANSQWGRKLKGKLQDQQCGPTAEGIIRMLVVNFSMADTRWPHFISANYFTSRFRDTIKLLVGQDSPFDVVVPAQLGINCCFGQSIWLTENQRTAGTRFITKAELDRQCQSPPPPSPSPEEIEEVFRPASQADG